jgi:hypothetical protein
MPNDILPGAEFQALPLEYVLSMPILATVKAQAVAADATRAYIERLVHPQTRRPLTVDVSVEHPDESGGRICTQVRTPLLTLAPVPALRIDGLKVQFRYEVTHTIQDSRSVEGGMQLGVQAGPLLGPWVDAGFKGQVSSRAASESTTNRSGALEIELTASEAPVPEGLARLLSFLSNSVAISSEPAP